MAGVKIMIKIYFSFCTFICFFLLNSTCNKYDKNDGLQQDNPQIKITRITFYDNTNKKNLEITAEVAESYYSQAKGLMYRENLAENEGMFFVYKDEKIRNFWMKNTPLSLDIIYFNEQLQIIKIHSWTTPFSEQLYSSIRPAQYVLEVNGGFTERYHIMEGHWIKWQDL